jgi:lycopene beta-cyclase
MVARTLAAAPLLAESVVQRLGGSTSIHVPTKKPDSPCHLESTAPSQQLEASIKVEESSGPQGDELAAGVWADLWPLDRQQQRAFFCFGMDVLLKVQNVYCFTFL